MTGIVRWLVTAGVLCAGTGLRVAAGVREADAGEYSSPSVIQGGDGGGHVTYTWRRQRIEHAAVDPARMQSVPMPDGAWPSGVQ